MTRPLTISRHPDDASAPAVPSVPPQASAGQRWRWRRNLVIYLAYRQGLSQRFLADVFDLPRSRISEIVRDFRPYEVA